MTRRSGCRSTIAPSTLRSAPLIHIALAISNGTIGAIIGIKLQSVFAMALFVTSFHDLQYNGAVWHGGRRRYAKLPDANPLSGLFTPRRLFLSALLILAGGGRQFPFGLVERALPAPRRGNLAGYLPADQDERRLPRREIAWYAGGEKEAQSPSRLEDRAASEWT